MHMNAGALLKMKWIFD